MSSQIAASTSPRSDPSSCATMPEPSLTTVVVTATRSLWIELEHDTGDFDIVAGLKPLLLQRGDDAHAPQPALDMGQGLVVVEVVACDQALDLLAADAEHTVLDALDVEAASGRRTEDAMLGQRLLGRK